MGILIVKLFGFVWYVIVKWIMNEINVLVFGKLLIKWVVGGGVI